jgi:hypothetical protein
MPLDKTRRIVDLTSPRLASFGGSSERRLQLAQCPSITSTKLPKQNPRVKGRFHDGNRPLQNCSSLLTL